MYNVNHTYTVNINTLQNCTLICPGKRKRRNLFVIPFWFSLFRCQFFSTTWFLLMLSVSLFFRTARHRSTREPKTSIKAYLSRLILYNSSLVSCLTFLSALSFSPSFSHVQFSLFLFFSSLKQRTLYHSFTHSPVPFCASCGVCSIFSALDIVPRNGW